MNYSFDILTLQSPSPKTQNSDHLNIIHTKKLREKRKSIPDSCCHLHLLHLLRQGSFLFFFLLKLLSFCFVSFSFCSFVFSTLFCFVCLCLTKLVKLSNSSLYASATSIKCNFVHLHYLFYHLYYFIFCIDCLFYYLFYFILSIDCLFY